MFSTLTTTFCKNCNTPFQQAEDEKRELCLDCQFPKEEKGKAQEVIITPALLDTSKLGESNEVKEYRPSSFEEFVGQNSAKERVSIFIEGCKKFGEIYPHTFLSAPCGMGKTLFATILSNQLEKKIVFTTGGELKSEQMFIDKLIDADGGIVFIDEANRLPKKVGFFILPLSEQFEIHGKAIRKFTLIFATTHRGDISKDLDALIQRCEEINFVPYNEQELEKIILQYQKKQYPSIKIPDNVLKEIINSSRQTPRNAKNFVRAYAYAQDWGKIKRYNSIIKDGLTDVDIKVLTYLKNCGGAGQNSIANHLRVKPQTYAYSIEPYLVYKELIEVSNKRKISLKGLEFLNNLNKEE
jgi:Holliday junction DNA helicase RuvB